MAKPEIRYFISYAHNDNAFFQVFKEGINTHLRNSGRYTFKAWDDSEIPVGSQWHKEIQGNLVRSQFAILCVSGNFLNSEYIRSNEFEILTQQFPQVKIIPVYFSASDFSGWKDLAEIQFFKPDGNRYDENGTEDFSFCDLVKFSDRGLPIPNANLAKYFKDLAKRIEDSLGGVITADTDKLYREIKKDERNEQPEKETGGKLVNKIFIAVMAASAVFVLFCLLFQKMNTEGMFRSSLGSVMFFFSAGLYSFKNKKSVAV